MRSTHPTQAPADAAVVLPTILRPNLLRAARSVFTQNFDGRIHLLVGVDVALGNPALLDTLAAECPAHVMLTVVDPGYSTSRRHGGMHANHYSGSLRTVLSYLANSRYVAYLDDNDWWSANHLALLKTAIQGKAWAWSSRWVAHPDQWPICRDEWDSVGPGKGINAERFGGFVQPSGLMMDMTECHFIVPLWSMAAFPDGSGEDRLIFDQLRRLNGGATGQYTSFCTLDHDTLFHDHHRREFLERGLAWVNDRNIYNKIKQLDADLNTLAEHGDWAGAAGVAEQILRHNPHHAAGLRAQAMLKDAEGNAGGALLLMAQAVEIDDTHPDWLDRMAQWARRTGDEALAVRIETTRRRRFGGSLGERP